MDVRYNRIGLELPKKIQGRVFSFQRPMVVTSDDHKTIKDEDLKNLAKMIKSARRVQKLEINCEKYVRILEKYLKLFLFVDQDYYYLSIRLQEFK